MVDDFRLIDLVSQRDAVRAHLAGSSADEVLTWLGRRGRLSELVGEAVATLTPSYRFESLIGREATFFFLDGELVFVGDHHTFR